MAILRVEAPMDLPSAYNETLSNLSAICRGVEGGDQERRWVRGSFDAGLGRVGGGQT